MMKFLLSVLLIAINAKDTRNADLRKSNQALLQALKALSLSTEQQIGQSAFEVATCRNICGTKFGCAVSKKGRPPVCDTNKYNNPKTCKRVGGTCCNCGVQANSECKVPVSNSRLEVDCDGCKVSMEGRDPECAWGYSETQCTEINDEHKRKKKKKEVTVKYCEASCLAVGCYSCYHEGKCVTEITETECERRNGRKCGTNFKPEEPKPRVGERSCVTCICSGWTPATGTYWNCTPGTGKAGYLKKCQDGGKIALPGRGKEQDDACTKYLNGDI